MGRLEIRVCGARNLGNTQKIGVPDPYVKVKVGEKKKTQLKYKTRVIENTLNPVWNELFKFQVADYDTTQIVFEVWNDNVMVDDLMGSYALSINGLEKGVVKDTWAILTGTKKSTAEIHLTILAVDFGRPAPAGATTATSLEQDNITTPSNQTYRPHKSDAQLAALQSNAAAPQGLPPTVAYGPATSQNYNYMPPQQAFQSNMIRPPVQQVQYGVPQSMYGMQPQYRPPPPQPVYNAYAPQPQLQQPYYPPQPQPMYAPPPMPMMPPQQQPMYAPYQQPQQQRPMQMAMGVPPDM